VHTQAEETPSGPGRGAPGLGAACFFFTPFLPSTSKMACWKRVRDGAALNAKKNFTPHSRHFTHDKLASPSTQLLVPTIGVFEAEAWHDGRLDAGAQRAACGEGSP
jgi:hypothetical protein